jgi:hypothetical protein
MYKHASCTDFIGFSYGGTLDSSTFTYAAGPPIYYNYGGAREGYAVSNVGGAKTTVNGNNVNAYAPGNPSVILACAFIDIIKRGTSGVNVTIWRNTQIVDATTGRTPDTFWRGMENENAVTGTMTSFVMDFPSYAGNFAWDTVNLAWNKSGPFFMEIGSLAVTRFQ